MNSFFVLNLITQVQTQCAKLIFWVMVDPIILNIKDLGAAHVHQFICLIGRKFNKVIVLLNFCYEFFPFLPCLDVCPARFGALSG